MQTRNRMMLGVLAMASLPVVAQQSGPKPMGSVGTADAKVSGGLEVAASRVKLVSSANVTALDHTAQIDLERGGNVALCASSEFHLLRSGTAGSLLFALDRGAMEIHSRSETQDAVVTPDLRFTLLTPGVLDLRIRVTREGDTCVENRGAGAPVLQVTESFSSSEYHVAPGQHVLFERGSVRDVVDNERSNCGCPGTTPAMVASSNANGTSSVGAEQAAAMHPFPEAQSQGRRRRSLPCRCRRRRGIPRHFRMVRRVGRRWRWLRWWWLLRPRAGVLLDKGVGRRNLLLRRRERMRFCIRSVGFSRSSLAGSRVPLPP